MHVIYGCGSVLLWQRRGPTDTLRICGFIDDVIFAHTPRLLDVAAQLKHSAHHRHRIDKYLDTLLANQPISDGEATDRCKSLRRKMADCPS